MTNSSEPLDHHTSCTCSPQFLATALDRRRFLYAAAGGLAAAALAPLRTLATGRCYEAMVLSCIDPRMQGPVRKYLRKSHLTKKYSQFTIAGASIGVVAPRFEDWHETFWENLKISIQLHRISKVIVINHRDCGAAKEAYGCAAVADPATERETHRKALAQFREQLVERHCQLKVVAGLMDLKGHFEVIS